MIDSKKNPPVAVKQTEGAEPVTREILADAIVRISDGLTAMRKSGVNKEAIIILVAAHTRVARADVRIVIDALADLKKWYCE